VDQAVDGRSRKHQAAAKVADEGDMVGLGAVGRDHDEHANNDGQVKD
jgi:hypothetical protein